VTATGPGRPGHGESAPDRHGGGQGPDLVEEFERTGDLAVLRAAVEVLRDEGDDLRLSEALRLLGEETADPLALDAAAEAARRHRAQVPADSPAARAGDLSLALALWAKADLTGETAVLEQTVATLRHLSAAGPADPEGARYLANLGLALRELFGVVGDRPVLAEAIEVLRRAEQAAADRFAAEVISANLALALQDWCEETGEPAALDEAITRMHACLEAVPDDDPSRAAWASNLSTMYQDRYEADADRGALAEAVRWGRLAVVLTEQDHPDRPARLTHLGLALRMTYEATGDGPSLEEAIRVSRDAVQHAGEDHPRIAIYESNLASALRFWYERTGEADVLKDAITFASAAVAHTPPDHHRLAGYESNLSLALWTRYERTAHLGSLQDAVDAARRAVAACQEDQPDLARYRTNLGLALWTLAERQPTSGALDEAIAVLRQVMTSVPPGHAEAARFAANLSNALWARYRRGGSELDLIAAVEAARTAYSDTRPEHVDHAAHAGNLGVLLAELNRHRSGQQTHDGQVREEALHVLREAVAAATGKEFDLALHLHNLAETLADGDPTPDDLAEAYRYSQQAAASPVAPYRVRVPAARTAADIALRRGDPTGALNALTDALDLLPELVRAPLDRTDQEFLLTLVSGTACDAAAAAIEAGEPQSASVVLDRGRGVLLRAVTDPDADRRALQAVAPDLAEQLERLSQVPGARGTDSPPVPAGITAPPPASLPEAGPPPDADRLLSAIRACPQAAGIFQPPPVPVLPADLGGPVIVVNLSKWRCDALIVVPDTADRNDETGSPSARLAVQPLLGVDPDQIAAHARRLQSALLDLQSSSRWGQRAAEADVNTILETLRTWLADHIVTPVLDRLQTDGALPRRLWWSPTAALTGLPLHAATDPRLDSIATSVTPTLRALTTAARAAATVGRSPQAIRPAQRSAVVVDVAEDLPSTPREVAALVRRHPEAMVLSGPEATPAAVTAAATSSEVIHVCAHALTDPDRPSLGHLELADGELTVDQISRWDLSGCRLAYLSACSTAQGSDQLPDEALTLAAAFAVAGAHHVVASLWPVVDDAAADLAETFYDQLATGHPPASALHRAVLALRAHYPDRPALWAPFVHLGP
jgi:CHAT domain-containing protein